MTPEGLLQQWLDRRLDAAAAVWLRESVSALAGGGTDRDLFRVVSLVSRKLGKAPLALERRGGRVGRRRRGPAGIRSRGPWTRPGRIRLLLAAATDADTFVRRLDQLCATADVDELVAFYRGLPLYPDPPRHRLRAAEGVRTNMKSVFEAVAHRNPYPAEQMPEDAWNQMVLKALFVGSTLDPIVGLDGRANPTLARMLDDYAHERWSAGRPVSPELWRCVGPFATGPMLADLERVLTTGTPPERAAAVLALRRSPDPEAGRLLDRHAALRDAVAARGIDWKIRTRIQLEPREKTHALHRPAHPHGGTHHGRLRTHGRRRHRRRHRARLLARPAAHERRHATSTICRASSAGSAFAPRSSASATTAPSA